MTRRTHLRRLLVTLAVAAYLIIAIDITPELGPDVTGR